MYKRNSAKEIQSRGLVFAATTTNSKLNAKFRKEELGSTEIETVAGKDFQYDIYCHPSDLKKVQSIY